MFNNDIDRLKGVADTVLEVIKKTQENKADNNLDEAITRTVKDGVTHIKRTGADAKTQHVTPGKFGYGPSRAKSLAKMGMAAAEAEAKKKEALRKEDMTPEELKEYTPGPGGVTRVTGKSYGASTKEKDSLDIDGPSSKELKQIDREKNSKKPFSNMREDYAQNGLSALQKKYNDLSVTPGQSAEPAFYADKQTDGTDHQTDNTRSATKKNQDQYEAEMKKNQKFMSQRKNDKEEAASGSVPSTIRVSVRNESAPMSNVTNDDIHEPLDEMYPRSFNGGVRVLKNSKELTPAQQEIDVVDDDKIDAKDFKKLRSMKKEGDSPEADYERNMKHHVMKDTVAMKKKGMSGLEPVTEKDEYFDNVIAEKKMTDDEEEHKEYIVKGMKKNLKSFKDTYGKDAKNVMYATATKLAQKDDLPLDELTKKTLGSYIKKSHKDAAGHSYDYGSEPTSHDKVAQDRKRKIYNRRTGIERAADKVVRPFYGKKGLDHKELNYEDKLPFPGAKEVKTKGLRQDPKKPAYIGAMVKHKVKNKERESTAGGRQRNTNKSYVDSFTESEVNEVKTQSMADKPDRLFKSKKQFDYNTTSKVKKDKYGTPILTPAQKKSSDERRARAKAQYMSDNQR